MGSVIQLPSLSELPQRKIFATIATNTFVTFLTTPTAYNLFMQSCKLENNTYIDLLFWRKLKVLVPRSMINITIINMIVNTVRIKI